MIARTRFGYPERSLKIIGITGTDGKTSTSEMLYWILKSAGKNVGLISTVGAKIGSRTIDTGLHVTSPEPFLLHKLLRKMVDYGCEYGVLEVTSHGLDQGRVAGIKFEVGVLTNISHEHLDYHKTMARYIKAKAKLLNASKITLINKDDPHYLQVLSFMENKSNLRTYSTRFAETFNQKNAVCAIAAAQVLDIDRLKSVKALSNFPGIAGRLEEIKNRRGFKIIIDFAHKPNALENVLLDLRRTMKKGQRLIAVFGCAGERDVQKRPMMAAISTRLADVSVFTAEDPRSEDVGAIFRQMVKGVIHHFNNIYYLIPERGEAISFAINKLAKKGDTVAVLGKGHERSMCYGQIEYPWSDREGVEKALGGKIKHILDKSNPVD